MRSLAVLTLAAALFAGFLIRAHFKAAALLARETTAVERLRNMARKAADRSEVATAAGYRFAWATGEDLPDLLVASPQQRGVDGVRWFATRSGMVVYQFDTVLFRARGTPPTIALQRYLLLPDAKRAEAPPPPGWKRFP